MACLLISCSKQSHWSHEKIHSHDEQYSYGKLIYSTRDPVHGVDVEIIQFKDQLKTFLTVHSTAVPPCSDSPKKVKLWITIDEMRIDSEADRFEGGQRFLIPEHIARYIIDALADNKNVYIQVPGYRSLVQAEGFLRHYQKIQRSFIENPWRLPF